MTNSSSKELQFTVNEAVSVVIPVYNGASTLARALDSVLAQSFSDYRILLVDDCSTDDTVALAASYRDPRITIIRHETNLGAAAARNTAIRRSRGSMVAFLDADDAWHPQKLEKQVAFLQRSGARVGACFCDFRVHRGGVSVNAPRPRRGWFDSFLDGCFVSPGSTMVVRRDVYLEVGDYDTTFERLEDWDWLLRCSTHFDLEIVPEVLVEVFITGEPKSGAVEVSAQRMLVAHSKAILAKRGNGGFRRFKASLVLENLVAALREGEIGLAFRCLFQALLLSPARVWTLVIRKVSKNLLRRVG